jgi:hypothetical protein
MANSTNGISPSQAQMFIQMLQAQSQAAMVSALTGDGTATDSTNSGDSFDALFSGMLGGPTGLSGPSTLSGLANLSSLSGLSSLSTLGIANSPYAALLGTLDPTGTPGGSAMGDQIAAIATQLAGALRGANNNAYDPTQTPLGVQQIWNSSGWDNGNVQCVAFVDGVFRQAGVALPQMGNANAFWGEYANQPGWREIPNGQGLPQPGDIIALSGGPQGYGHVAVVTQVIPPANGQPGQVVFAQSNSPTAQGTLPITPDGQAQAWPGYTVQGYIRYDG